MEPIAQFRDLSDRVRAGDGEAAVELVQRYEPEVRRLIRLRLTGPKLRLAVVVGTDITDSASNQTVGTAVTVLGSYSGDDGSPFVIKCRMSNPALGVEQTQTANSLVTVVAPLAPADAGGGSTGERLTVVATGGSRSGYGLADGYVVVAYLTRGGTQVSSGGV